MLRQIYEVCSPAASSTQSEAQPKTGLPPVLPARLLDPAPLYVQLANILREMIGSGELEPRAPLPSESYL
jgi:hypothetical protein